MPDILEAFNRKERNLVIRSALGHAEESPLHVHEGFFERAWKAAAPFKGPMPSSNEVRWWTDFHFDWLVAAVAAYYQPSVLFDALSSDPDVASSAQELFENPGAGGKEALITGTQEDVDFLMSVQRTIIIVEAKAYTGFTVEQIRSKLDRLSRLEDFADQQRAKVGSDKTLRFRLLLMGPVRPINLDALFGDEKLKFLEMGIDGIACKARVTRCNEDGIPSANGARWRIVRDRRFDKLDSGEPERGVRYE